MHTAVHDFLTKRPLCGLACELSCFYASKLPHPLATTGEPLNVAYKSHAEGTKKGLARMRKKERKQKALVFF